MIRAAAFLSLATGILLAPLLVPLPLGGLRLIVSLASILVTVKLYDLFQCVDRGEAPGVLAFLGYLPNDCLLVFQDAPTAAIPPRRSDAIRLLWLVPLTLCSAGFLVAALRFDWRPYPCAVEHLVKAAAVGAVIQFGPNIGASVRRLGGIPALDFSGWFAGSATPAEFWRRWNMPAGRFLWRYVYAPVGGGRRPFLALMATFGLNGLVHEYVFGIAAGRVLGSSLLFFLIQGLATAATFRLRPARWGRAIGVLLTLMFILASSVLLFVCVNAVVPYYAQRP